MHPKWLVYFLSYFDFWGFCTEYNYRPKIVHSIFLFHCLLGIAFTFFIADHIRNYDENGLANVNEIVKFVGSMVVYWSSIIESYWKRTYQKKFWNIQKQLNNSINNRSYSKKLWKKLWFIVMYTSVITIYFTNFIIRRIFTEGHIQFWITFTFVKFMYLNRIFYYILHLKLILFELETIWRRLQVHSSPNQYRRIRQQYQAVVDLCDCVNSVFEWSNFVTILYTFLLTLTDLNWVYWQWFNSREFFAGKFNRKDFNIQISNNSEFKNCQQSMCRLGF